MADGDRTALRAGAIAAGSTTTADGATVTICSYTLPTNALTEVEVVFWAVEIGTRANIYHRVQRVVADNTAGAAAIRNTGGTPRDVLAGDDPGAVGMTATTDANGATLRAQGTGVAVTDIRWYAAIFPCEGAEDHA